MVSLACLLWFAAAVRAWSEEDMWKYVDHLNLVSDFIPVLPEHGMAHHVRTPFAISEDAKSVHVSYVEGSRYLDHAKMKVHVQALDPFDFSKRGNPCTIEGADEASGLVSLNDGGFTVLTSLNFTKTDAEEFSIPVVARYTKDCEPIWTRPVGGKTVPMHWLDSWTQPVYLRSRRLDGDLVYSPQNRTYAAFFRTSFYGEWAGHGGDVLIYIDDNDDEGRIMTNYGTKHNNTEIVKEPVSKTENVYSLFQRCAHEYGLAIAPSDSWPFPAVCTDDEGFIKIVTDNFMGNGNETRLGNMTLPEAFAGEAFGGVHGSYSAMAPAGDDAYLMTWVSRPTIAAVKHEEVCDQPPHLCRTGWCGPRFRQCDDEVKTRNVQFLRLDNKIVKSKLLFNNTLKYEKPTISITPYREKIDCSNARVSTFNETLALLTWEEEEVESCRMLTGCRLRKYNGTFFLRVDAQGKSLEPAFISKDVFVSGDIIRIWDQMCWPYIHMNWNTSRAELDKYPMENEARSGLPFFTTRKLSFACMSMW